jgi:hypothetical protein
VNYLPEFGPFKWGRKPWQKQLCRYELQEVGGGRGWHTMDVEPIGDPRPKTDFQEFFSPGHHYRLIARAIEEGDKPSGGFVGVVWTHYEPSLAITKPEVKKEPAKKSRGLSSPAEYLEAYAKQVETTMGPMIKIANVMSELRDSLFPGAAGNGAPSAESPYGAIEFDGKAPWWMHPAITQNLANTFTQVIDHAADKFQEALRSTGLGRVPPEEEEEEEEEVEMPSLFEPEEEYAEEEEPVEEAEEEVAEEEEEIIESEEVPEGPKTVPDLVEKTTAKVCANCGEEKELLPNGLCKECAKKISKETAEAGD